MTATATKPTSATARVAELESTRDKWTAEEATARAKRTTAELALETASLSDPAKAYALVSEMETLDTRAAAAAHLAATASSQLRTARRAVTMEEAGRQREAADALWSQWREHQAHTDDLLRQLNAHEGVPFSGQRNGAGVLVPTTGDKLFSAAEAADRQVSLIEVDAVGEAAVIRSGPPKDGQRTVWIYTAGARRQPGTPWQARRFTVTVDGQPFMDLTSDSTGASYPFLREVPADAVVEIRGETTHFFDDPADR